MRRLAGIVTAGAFAVALAAGAARADRLMPRADLFTAFALETFGRAPLGPPAFVVSGNVETPHSRVAPIVRLDGLQRHDLGALKGLAFRDGTSERANATSLTEPVTNVNLQVAYALPAAVQLPALVAFHPQIATPNVTYAPLQSGGTSASFVNLAGLEHAITPVEGATGFEALRADLQFGGSALGAGVPNAYVSGVQLRDDRMAAGTGFNVRAGNRSVNIQFGTSYDRLTRSDAATFSYVPAPADPLDQAALPTAQSLLVSPGSADLTRRQINAALAVPVTQNLTLGLQYNTQRYNGTYGALITPNVDTRNDAYLGKLSYVIPRTSSVITFSARQLRFQDNLSPAASSWQMREDVKLTVKF